MRKNLAIAGLAAGLVGGGVAGFALASPSGLAGASSYTTVQDEGDITPDGQTEDAGPREPRQWLSDVLQPLVDDGTLTAEQREAVVEALRAAGPQRADGPRWHDHHRGPGFRMALDPAAAAIGITEDDLVAQLREGQTLADVATANGVEPQAVVDAIVAEASAHLAEEVTEGDLTQEQADERLAELTERVTQFVNEGRPPRPGSPPTES